MHGQRETAAVATTTTTARNDRNAVRMRIWLTPVKQVVDRQVLTGARVVTLHPQTVANGDGPDPRELHLHVHPRGRGQAHHVEHHGNQRQGQTHYAEGRQLVRHPWRKAKSMVHAGLCILCLFSFVDSSGPVVYIFRAFPVWCTASKRIFLCLYMQRLVINTSSI